MILKKQRPSSILGLAFDGDRIEAVTLKKTNGHYHAARSASAPLALSPLTGDPELVGREIRNVLEQAGIRERRCIVALPLNWILTQQVSIPEISDEEVPGFLDLEAERGFHGGLETMSIVQSVSKLGKERLAILIAAPRTNIASIQAVLKAAHLRPESFSISISSAQDPATSEGVAALFVGSGGADLQVSCGGGLVALRFLQGTSESEGAQKRFDADVAAREIRITLGQLPAGFQAAIKTLRVFGRGEVSRRFASDITPRAEAMGLKVELIERCGPQCLSNVTPQETPLTPALALAARFLSGAAQPFEFLPPRVSAWRKFVTSKVAGRRLGVAGAVVGGLALVVGGAFLYQGIRIWSLNSQLTAIAPRVRVIEAAQKNIRTYNQWFDDNYRTLTTLKTLSGAFPEDGRVYAKTLDIREDKVICSGVARSRDAVVKVTENLRKAPGIATVNLDNMSGESPVNFTFNFQMGESPNAN